MCPQAELLAQKVLFFFLLHLLCLLFPCVSSTPCKSWHFILPAIPFIPLFYTIASYSPWQTSCSGWAPFSCPQTFCLCFSPYLFLWSLFPILFPVLMTCSRNDDDNVLSSCKTILHSPYPLRACFSLLHQDFSIPSPGKDHCIYPPNFLLFLLVRVPVFTDCLCQSVHLYSISFSSFTIWEISYLRGRWRRGRIKVLKDVSGCLSLNCLTYKTLRELLQETQKT